MQFVPHRVADNRILRLIQKWLKAGVMEEGQWEKTEVGTPQGAVISPLLANVYLHYAFDLWAEAWRRKVARGQVVVVRYADDLVVGFQNKADAERFLKEFQDRLAKFGLELHPEKTRLLEFGRFAAVDRHKRGEKKPETFPFLGSGKPEGFSLGVRIAAAPPVVGPFNYFDLRARLSQTVADLTAWNNYRSAGETLRANQMSALDARDLVVLAVGGAYLQVIAAKAKLESARAQLETANTLYRQTAQQRGVSLQNDFAKQKINLARVTGLPPTDQYEIAADVPFSPAPAVTVEDAVKQAIAQRPDLKAADGKFARPSARDPELANGVHHGANWPGRISARIGDPHVSLFDFDPSSCHGRVGGPHNHHDGDCRETYRSHAGGRRAGKCEAVYPRRCTAGALRYQPARRTAQSVSAGASR